MTSEDPREPRRCDDCHAAEATRTARISTIPGSGYGRLVMFHLCSACYDRNDWQALDFGGTPWELTLQDAPGASDTRE